MGYGVAVVEQKASESEVDRMLGCVALVSGLGKVVGGTVG